MLVEHRNTFEIYNLLRIFIFYCYTDVMMWYKWLVYVIAKNLFLKSNTKVPISYITLSVLSVFISLCNALLIELF